MDRGKVLSSVDVVLTSSDQCAQQLTRWIRRPCAADHVYITLVEIELMHLVVGI